ncbi:MAG TPA: HEPN domain-containing protein [Anaerolineae bacterium]|nr:HEPN domain-containing protein [Anaerolineae bacterium]
MAVQVLGKRSKLLSKERVPHLSNEEREQVAALLARLEAECEGDIQRVILYGSKARGNADQESDVDLFIATKDGTERIKQIVEAWEKEIDYHSSPIVYSAKDYEYNMWLMPPFYVNVRRDGIELWDESAAIEEERQAPLNFFEGKDRAMNESTLELIRQYWEQTKYFWEMAMYDKRGGYLRGSVSRAFYAVFHAVSAALYTINVVRGKHSAVESAIHEYLIQPGLLEPEYGKIYSHLMRGRQLADYGNIRKPGERPRFETLSDEEMNQMLAEAERFITRMEQFLRERGALID